MTQASQSPNRPTEERIVELLAYVGQIVSSSKSLDTILYATLNMIRSMLDVERCSVMILDPVEKVLRMRSATVIPREEWPLIKVPLGDSISGIVARDAKPLLIEDIKNSPYSHFARGGGYNSESIICVPIQVKGRVIGVLNVNNRPDQNAFSRGDLELVLATAGFVGLAIENARLGHASEDLRTHLEGVVESLHHGVVSATLEGRITLWNQRFLALLGLTEEDVTGGKELHDCMPPSLWEVIKDSVYDSREYAVESRIEVDFNAPGLGRIPLEVRTSPLTDARGRLDGILVTLADLTVQRELAELRRLGQLEANFLAMVSHELRTPLTAIKGAVSILESNSPVEHEQAQTLQRIIASNSERLIRIVNDLLDVVKIEHHTFTIVRARMDLAAAVEAALKPCKIFGAQKDVSIEKQLAPCEVDGDDQRLRQVVWQLVDNAIKFSPKGQKVEVKLERQGRFAVLTVRDHGSGIPASTRSRVFDRFYQCEGAMTRSAGGTGVGLFLAKTVVDEHGGRIELLDTGGNGTEFKVSLPLPPGES